MEEYNFDNKELIIKTIDLLHTQLRYDCEVWKAKEACIAEKLNKVYANWVSSEGRDGNWNEIYSSNPAIFTIETTLKMLFYTLALQDEKMFWCLVIHCVQFNKTEDGYILKTVDDYMSIFTEWLYDIDIDCNTLINMTQEWIANNPDTFKEIKEDEEIDDFYRRQTKRWLTNIK